jgi:hypothetical protein
MRTQSSQPVPAQCDCNAWAQISDSELLFTRDEVEQLADKSITTLVASDEFEIMDMRERTDLISYLIASKRAMYRYYH